MNLKYRQTCRVCGSPHLKPVIDLGPQHFQGSFVKPGAPAPPQRRVPCVLVRCDPSASENGCGLLQMRHSVPTELLYSSYWYRSGTNTTMRNHLAGIVKAAVDLVKLRRATVLDIGCNDGTLLREYPNTWSRHGVDPSNVAGEITDLKVFRDVFPTPSIKDAQYNVITSIAMFYDLEDPVAFARAIAAALKPEGVWIVEMSHMPTMLQRLAYDTIVHEHLEYYSLAVIERICAEAGLRVFRAELNESNGGSLRCFIHKPGVLTRPPCPNLAAIRQAEFDMELDTDKPYQNFQYRVEAHRQQLRSLLMDLVSTGKRVHLYGASTKANTLLQWCGLDSRLIAAAAERNPEKFGAKTQGTGIPIVSEDESRALRPDYYLVGPWHFKKEILEREAATLRAGTGFIFPLPEIEIIEPPCPPLS